MKIYYKIWKKLTKKLIKDKAKQNEVLSIFCKQQIVDKKTISNQKYKYPDQIIVSGGFYCTGSSVLSGLFREFDNIAVLGHPEPLYIKNSVTKHCSETQFFFGSKFCEFVNSFKKGSATEKDYYIKYFINSVQKAINEGCTCTYEYMPELYNDYFKQITRELLFNVLDLDNYTYAFMKDKEFPIIFESSSDTTYENCNFMHNKGIRQYLFYRFKNLSVEEFDSIISKYLKSFFSILGEKNIVAYDQLLPNDYLETINYYLRDRPIKQISIWRDPRDLFVSAIRSDMLLMPRSIDGFVDFYKNYRLLDFYKGLEWCLSHPNPNRLVMRFEDLVLKYDDSKNKILNFLDIASTHHINPKTIFDPAISVNNIGAYKYFTDQVFIRQIEERLSEYCYYPEKENLSNEAWNLLESTGNWKRE